MAGKKRHGVTKHPVAIIVTISLFAIWGFANRIHDIVAPQFNRYFALNDIQSMLSYASFGLSYVFLAVPAAMFLRRFGYKLSLVMGLAAFSIGAFLLYPAVTHHEPLYYVAAVVATGSGWAVLETSANPLILRMGPQESAVRRLNLAQTVYPLGLIVAYWLGRHIVLPSSAADGQFLEDVVRPYVVVGLAVMLLGFLIEYIEFPKLASERDAKGVSMRREATELLSRVPFRFALLAMAIYMTGLVLLWSSTAAYARHAVPGISKAELIQLTLYTWVACTCGRAAGTALMYWINPNRLMAVFALIAAASPLIALTIHGYEGIALLLGTTFFIGIMFPTIFGTAVNGLGGLTKTASGLMVTAAGAGMCIGMLANKVFTVIGLVHVSLTAASLFFAGVMAFARYCERAHVDKPANTHAEGRRQALSPQ